MVARLLFCALSGALLVACETVQFQSPPQMPLAACDARWVGDWRIEDLPNEGNEKERQYLRVAADCARWQTLSVGTDEQGNGKADIDDLGQDMTLGFAATANQTYVAALEDNTAAARPDKPVGYTLIAYTFANDGSIELQQVDVRKVANLIIDGRVPGWVEKRDRSPDGRTGASSSFWVFVFGSAEETRAFLEHHDVVKPPWLRLIPADGTDQADIDFFLANSDGTVRKEDGG